MTTKGPLRPHDDTAIALRKGGIALLLMGAAFLSLYAMSQLSFFLILGFIFIGLSVIVFINNPRQEKKFEKQRLEYPQKLKDYSRKTCPVCAKSKALSLTILDLKHDTKHNSSSGRGSTSSTDYRVNATVQEECKSCGHKKRFHIDLENHHWVTSTGDPSFHGPSGGTDSFPTDLDIIDKWLYSPYSLY